MTRLARLTCPLAILAALAFAPAPARAQFGDDAQMQQFAPMLEMMKQHMGKKRFGEMMKMMGPMMANMEGQGGLSSLMGGGGFGGFGGGMQSLGGFDMGQMMTMISTIQRMAGPRRKARRR
jgi:hypothetical protein